MQTALLAPDDALDPQERNFVAKIREHGWFFTNVFAESGSPGFCYTTGFWVTLGQPEIIIFGIKSEIAHAVASDMFQDLKAGRSKPLRTRSSEILGNHDAYLFPVDKAQYPEYLGWSRWFYAGDEFPCSQLVWPDREGRFPWQPPFDNEMATLQPDVAEGGWQLVH